MNSHDPWARLLRVHAVLTRELSARLELEHGLSLREFDVLARLYGAPGRSLRRIDLARQVLVTASGVTRLLEGLEESGYVERGHCASDARVSYAVLTEAGACAYTRALATHTADVEELFVSHLTDAERDELELLLAKLPAAETACPIADGGLLARAR